MPRAAVRTKHKIVAAVEGELLKHVRRHHGLSRVELARKLHLAPSTAGIYVDRLKREGYLAEGEAVSGRLGRRPTLLTPNPAAGRFVGVDFEAHSLMTTVVDFSLQIVSRAQRIIPRGDTAEPIMRKIEHAIASAIRDDERPLLGLGVGVPGVIDAVRGTASHYAFVPDWKDVPVIDRLTRKFGVPVHLENNIRSMAMAELWLGQGRGLRDFVCLGVRTGIGVGVVANGELLGGTHGAAGDIGSWPAWTEPGGARAARGGRTLEEAASLSAILAAASRATGRQLDLDGLRAAAEACDRRVVAVLEEAAAIHGAAIRQLHLLFDPARIILAGPLAELGAAFLTPVTQAVGSRPDGIAPAIVNSTFGQFGGAVGAAALAAHRWKPARPA